MPSKRIECEIVSEGMPYSMDMIGVILSAIVFDEKRRSVDTIIVSVSGFQAASPGEVNFFWMIMKDTIQFSMGKHRSEIGNVFRDQSDQYF